MYGGGKEMVEKRKVIVCVENEEGWMGGCGVRGVRSCEVVGEVEVRKCCRTWADGKSCQWTCKNDGLECAGAKRRSRNSAYETRKQGHGRVGHVTLRYHVANIPDISGDSLSSVA